MEIRASDEDRRRVVAALERHTGAGRLTLDEFASRVEAATEARTLGDLAAVVSDLPAEAPPMEQPAEAEQHQLLWVFAVAVATLVLLGVFVALRS